MGRRYEEPPVIEAICEFHFEPDPDWDLTIPGLVYEELEDEFPERRRAKQLGIGFSTEAEKITQQVRTVERTQFVREDESALVQIGPNLLAVSHLEPYPTWQEYRPLIRTALDAYLEEANHEGLEKVALRYINEVEIGGEEIELEDYFQFYPYVGPGLPQTHGSFIVGVEVPYHSGRDLLRLQLTPTPSDDDGESAFRLDLSYDLVDAEEISLDSVLTWIDQAHDEIEEAFEASITDTLRDLFGET